MNIPERIKAVIFDVDGLMIDSEPAWQKSHDEFITKHNLHIDAKYKASFRGIGLKELVQQLKEQFHLEKSVEELLTEYREIFYNNFSHEDKNGVMHGVVDLVNALHEKGYTLAIATGGHTQETMKKILDASDLLSFFSLIVSSDEVQRGKPNPDVFLHTAEKLGLSPEECLVLEDSLNGIKAGKAAGMLVYGVNSHENIYEDLKRGGADEVYFTLEQVLQE